MSEPHLSYSVNVVAVYSACMVMVEEACLIAIMDVVHNALNKQKHSSNLGGGESALGHSDVS